MPLPKKSGSGTTSAKSGSSGAKHATNAHTKTKAAGDLTPFGSKGNMGPARARAASAKPSIYGKGKSTHKSGKGKGYSPGMFGGR